MTYLTLDFHTGNSTSCIVAETMDVWLYGVEGRNYVRVSIKHDDHYSFTFVVIRDSYSVLRSFIQIQFIKPDSWNLTSKFILDCKKVYILPTIFMHKQRRSNCFVWKCARMINHYLQHLYITPRFRYTIYTYVDLLIVEMKWIVSTVFSQICNWAQIRIDSYKHSCRSHCVLTPIYVS